MFWRYIMRRRRGILAAAACCAVFAGSFALYHLPMQAVLYPAALCAGIVLLAGAADYLRYRRAGRELGRIGTIAEAASAQYMQAEGDHAEEYCRIIAMMAEEHAAFRAQTGQKYSEMIEYYTVWAHQIKTPIAAMRLRLQSEDTPLARRMRGDLRRIEEYVEMVLAYLRLGSASTDYVFREHEIDDIVRGALKKFSAEFIERRLCLVYEPLKCKVVSDEKWLSFVIEQVLSNALKYTPGGSITISMEQEGVLRIRDTGIGIAPEDLPRIFENGYTGYNGRTDKKASGIGLYLCRRVCDNLGHTISVHSAPEKGTAVDIDLRQRKMQVE